MHEWDSIIFIMVLSLLTEHLEGVTWPGVNIPLLI